MEIKKTTLILFFGAVDFWSIQWDVKEEMWDSRSSTEPICIHVRWCERAPRRFLSGGSTFTVLHVLFWKWVEWPLRGSLPLESLAPAEPEPFRWCQTLLVAPLRSSYSYFIYLFIFYSCSWFAIRKIDISLTCKMLCLPPFSFCFHRLSLDPL